MRHLQGVAPVLSTLFTLLVALGGIASEVSTPVLAGLLGVGLCLIAFSVVERVSTNRARDARRELLLRLGKLHELGEDVLAALEQGNLEDRQLNQWIEETRRLIDSNAPEFTHRFVSDVGVPSEYREPEDKPWGEGPLDRSLLVKRRLHRLQEIIENIRSAPA